MLLIRGRLQSAFGCLTYRPRVGALLCDPRLPWPGIRLSPTVFWFGRGGDGFRSPARGICSPPVFEGISFKANYYLVGRKPFHKAQTVFWIIEIPNGLGIRGYSHLLLHREASRAADRSSGVGPGATGAAFSLRPQRGGIGLGDSSRGIGRGYVRPS